MKKEICYVCYLWICIKRGAIMLQSFKKIAPNQEKKCIMGRRKLLHDAFIRACRTRSIGTLPREHSFGSTVALPEPHNTTSRNTAPAVPLKASPPPARSVRRPDLNPHSPAADACRNGVAGRCPACYSARSRQKE